MPSVSLHLAGQHTAFSPRETIAGQASWQLDAPPKSAELRLFWSTSGRGKEEQGIVQSISFPSPGATETRPFTLTLPEAPYSFSGTLMTLTWTLELLVQPGNYSDGIDITIAPGSRTISLPRLNPA